MQAGHRSVRAWGFAAWTVALGVTAHVLAGGLPPSGAMLAGHLAVVLALACWLRCGEAARWRLLRLTAGRVDAVLALLEPAPVQPSTATGSRSIGCRAVLRPAPVPLLPDRRGPPAAPCG